MAIATPVEESYDAYGAAADLFRLGPTLNECLLAGPAGTGKSRAVLEYLNWLCMEHADLRVLMVRKTRRSLTESGMVTLEQKVLHPAQGVQWKASSQRYDYPTGSIIGVAGMDKPGKIMSSEWDVIYVQEATELSEAEWEACTTRLRNGKLPWQQIIGDCNPDAPTHWLRRRAQSGKLLMLHSRHEDNPSVTPDYLARLDELTGVRYLRLRLGQWAAAEGIVYEEYSPAIHIIPRFARTADNPRGDPPREWPRYVSIDWGYTNPTAMLCWAVDPDGRAYRYREIYMTRRTVDEHAAVLKREWRDDPLPRAVIADPEDADGRALFSRHTGWGTLAAHNDIESGIQIVRQRLRPAGDGKPRMLFLQDSLVERDSDLAARKLPMCTDEEWESYVWATNAAGIKETPVDANNHGLSAVRYFACYLDLGNDEPAVAGYFPW